MGAIDLAAEAADRVDRARARRRRRVGAGRASAPAADAARRGARRAREGAHDPARRGRAARPRARPPSRQATSAARSRRPLLATQIAPDSANAWARHAHALARTDRIVGRDRGVRARARRSTPMTPRSPSCSSACGAPCHACCLRRSARVSPPLSGSPSAGLRQSARVPCPETVHPRTLVSRARTGGPMPQAMRLRFAMLATLCAFVPCRHGARRHAGDQCRRRTHPGQRSAGHQQRREVRALLHAVVGRRAPEGRARPVLHQPSTR